MIKIIPKSKESIIGEYHLYPIMFVLEDALKIYKLELERFEKMEYDKMTGEEVHIMKWYENKVFDTEHLLKEINEAIENIEE